MINFPALRPTTRKIIHPVYPNQARRSVSGIEEIRPLAAKSSGFGLDLTYENIPTAEGETLLAAWTSAYNTIDYLAVPAAVFSGMETAFATLVSTYPTGVQWRFDSAPPVVAIGPLDTCTVSLGLRARLVD